nr:hypothetical protein [Tanacetum cinerariifolium]
MFNKENVNYPELICKDHAYQIDHKKEKRLRRENMPYPHFTKIIINHFLKQHKSLTNLNYKHYHTIKDDGIRRESYQMFIKYLTHQIPPKKSRGKGSKEKKTIEESQETVDVFKESKPESEPAKKKSLAKSISQTKAEEVEAARKVHATHSRIMIESVPEFAKKKSSGRSSKSAVIQDTSSSPKYKPV